MLEPRTTTVQRPETARARHRPVQLAIALDVADPTEALDLARRVSGAFDIAKVGLELFSLAGPAIVEALIAEGFVVFVDLKLHDIPNTVERAARALGRLGATYATAHAAGGRAMLAAAVAGFTEGAASAGLPSPMVLGVTLLTSDADAPPSLLSARVDEVLAAGAGGLVCAAGDLDVLERLAPGLAKVVPGIRPPQASRDDQARTATPAEAIAAGADVLVIGRPVIRAADPQAAAEAIAASLFA